MNEKMTITIEKIDEFLDICMEGVCFDETLLHALALTVKSGIKEKAFTVTDFLLELAQPENPDDIERSGTVTAIKIPEVKEGEP